MLIVEVAQCEAGDAVAPAWYSKEYKAGHDTGRLGSA